MIISDDADMVQPMQPKHAQSYLTIDYVQNQPEQSTVVYPFFFFFLFLSFPNDER